MNKRKLIITSSIANSFEWYDYALFAHLAPLIGKNFFPDADQSTVLLQAFLVFAVGYLMRPIGGIFFGIIGDKYGRKTSLSYAIICMALPTAAIGFLPTYETWGITSTYIMVILRITQGLSMGGALTGSISFIIEHSKKEERGLFGSIPMASILVGVLLGSVVLFIIKNTVSAETFNNWAWRLPFMFGIIIYFPGVYIKKHTAETPLFEDAKNCNELTDTPVKSLFKNYWLDLLISIGINMTGSIIFYLETIYLVSYLRINRGFGENEVTILTNCCYILMIFTILFAGFLSDKIGKRKLIVINLIFIITTIAFLLKIVETGSFISVAFAQAIISIMAAFYIAPEPALQAEFYPTKIRNTALSVSYNTATSIFGGTTPYIIESLIQNTGSIVSAVYYIVIAALIGLVSLFFYQNRFGT